MRIANEKRYQKIINSVVKSIIKKNRSGNLSKEDLINEGWVAVLEVVQKYQEFNDGLLYIRVRGHLLDVIRKNLTLLNISKRDAIENKQLLQKLILADKSRGDCYQCEETVEQDLSQDISYKEVRNKIQKLLGDRSPIFFDRVMHGLTLIELSKRYDYSHSNIAYILERCWKQIKESSIAREK